MDPNALADKEACAVEKVVVDSHQLDDGSASEVSTYDPVDFDGLHDLSDPQNWTLMYKWSMVVLISLLSLVVNLAILMCAPATSYILGEFHSTNKLDSTILVSIWELGEVVGSFLVAPLSEIYGRLPVYHAANILFIIFAIAAAESISMGMLIAMRFFLGLSVASTVINPCIVGDMFREEQRGRALGIMGMIPFIAPVLGPTVGGFISQAKGWRWTFWLIVIIASPLQLLFLLFYRETYRVRILQRKAARLRKETGNHSLRSRYELNKTPAIMLRDSVFRPLQLLFTSPVVLLVGICSALNMSLVYVIITSLSIIYDEVYHFRKGFLGLTYLGLGFGMILSVHFCGQFLDRYLQRKIAAGHGRPEHRLPPMVLGSVLVPLGVLAFGWTVQMHVHWVVPILFSTLVGFGFVANSISAWSYLVDAFGIYAASATAGNVVLRNAASAALPLAGPPLSERLGFGLGYSVLALVGVLAVPISLILMYMGERMRYSGTSSGDQQGKDNRAD
ncbi:MFS general substrate transporter [Glonium stellatum]|uniref:MFS general substrate transporter n=1 Tax=Glonium stellatum TaxID=574774 RepID=A0A8E2F3H6_9PEZI|nr:MFS general substrate transporter [Glonium stellatum]